VKLLWRLSYYLVIVPAGFVSKIFKRDKLKLNFDGVKASYREKSNSCGNQDGTPDAEESCPDTMYPMW
jgi:hypothetical protein